MLSKLYPLLPFKPYMGSFLTNHFFDSPLFIIACGRSGSTALVNSVGQHPAIISSPYEAPMLSYFGEAVFHYQSSDVNTYYQNSTQIPSDHLKYVLRSLCYETVWGKHFGLRNHLLHLKQQKKSFFAIRYWAVKTFLNEKQAVGFKNLFPKAKFVYIYRNGIDVVNSMMHFGWFSTQEFSVLCEFWAERVFQYDYLRQCENAVSIRHEDFLTSPGKIFNQLFQYLQIENTSASSKYAESHLIHPLNAPTRRANPRQEIMNRNSPSDNWSPEQKAIFKDICSEAMLKLGYPLPF